MKTLSAMFSIVSLLTVVSSGPLLRQAPYPPSGWRPNGPAFELPTEIKNQRTSEEITTSEVISQSSGFQEYGAAAFEQENNIQDLTIQELPSEMPSQFNIQNQESRSRLVDDIEAETESQESSTAEVGLKTTSLTDETHYVDRTEQYYATGVTTLSDLEFVPTTTESGIIETTTYVGIKELDQEKAGKSEDLLLEVSSPKWNSETLSQNLSQEETTQKEESTMLLGSNLKQSREAVNMYEESLSMKVDKENTIRKEEVHALDVTTEMYTIHTITLPENETNVAATTDMSNIEKTTFAPIVVLDPEEQNRTGENSEEFGSQSANGFFQGDVVRKEELSNVLSAEERLTQTISSSVKTFEEKLLTLERHQQLKQPEKSSSTLETVDRTNNQKTSGTHLETENLAEQRNLDYTAPIGFAEYGVPFEQYGPPQSGARRLEVDLTTGQYDLDSFTTKQMTEFLTPGKTRSDLPRDGRKRRYSPKIRNVNGAFWFNGKGPEQVNVL